MSGLPHRRELPCGNCLRETFHRAAPGAAWVCETCGNICEQTDYEPRPEVPSRPTKSVNPSGNEPETDYGTRQTDYEPQTDYERREGLTGEGLRDWDRREDFAAWVCERAGVRFEEGERQAVVVGGVEIVVSPWLADDGLWVVRLWEGWPASKRTSLSLTEIFTATVTGNLTERRGSEHAIWKRRTLVEAGLVAPAAVSLASLPPDAPPSAVATWNLARDVSKIRWLTEPGAPMPLVARWLQEWSGGSVPQSQIVPGKRWLKRQGFIEHVGNAPGSFGNDTFLWRLREASA